MSSGAGESVTQEKGRRRRHRRRDTISHMLQDGEKHLVWKPGCHRDSSKESPDQRQKTLLNRINSYRKSDARGVPEGVVCGGVVGVMVSTQKRMEQWQRIENEAGMAEESEIKSPSSPVVGGVAVGPAKAFAYPDPTERRGSGVRRSSGMSQAMVTITEEEEEGGKEGRDGSIEKEREEGAGGEEEEVVQEMEVISKGERVGIKIMDASGAGGEIAEPLLPARPSLRQKLAATQSHHHGSPYHRLGNPSPSEVVPGYKETDL